MAHPSDGARSAPHERTAAFHSHPIETRDFPRFPGSPPRRSLPVRDTTKTSCPSPTWIFLLLQHSHQTKLRECLEDDKRHTNTYSSIVQRLSLA
jgi:hypothetical protein